MQAGGGQADEDIARPHQASVEDPLLVHYADGEPGQVVLVLRVEAGHLGGLPSDQGALRLHAPLRHAGDYGGDPLRHVFTKRDIVQKEEGPRSGADYVVDAHGNAVDTHCVVTVGKEGELQLGAHSVGRGDQHRTLHAAQVRGKQAAEAPYVGHDPRNPGAAYALLDQLHRAVAGVDVHARPPVTFGPALHSHSSTRTRRFPYRSLSIVSGTSVG